MRKFKFFHFFVLIILVLIFSYASFAQGDKPRTLTILSTNDTHGNLDSFNYKGFENVGGISRRKTFVDEVRKNNKNVLVLDAGDFEQGTLYYTTIEEPVSFYAYNILGYDYVTLGNHDFERGIEYLKNQVKEGEMTFLAANIRFNDEFLDKEVKKYVIKNVNGLKVGIIGVVTDNLNAIIRDDVGVEVFDSAKIVKNIIKKIHKQTDIIIVLSHLGLKSDIKLAKTVEGIDVIIGGHSHAYLSKPYVVKNNSGKTIITQNGEFGVGMGKLDLEIKDKKIKEYKFKQHLMSPKIEDDEEMEEFLNKYRPIVKELREKSIGKILTPLDCRRTENRLRLTTAGALITGAIKYKYPHVDMVMVNGGVIRQGSIVPSGDITKADIMEIFPFDDRVIIVSMKGEDLLTVLESGVRKLPNPNSSFIQSSGVEYDVDLSRQPQKYSSDLSKIIFKGERVSNVKINGEPLEKNKIYTIAINDYMDAGSDGFIYFRDAKEKIYGDIKDRDILIEYLEKYSPLRITIKSKINIINGEKSGKNFK